MRKLLLLLLVVISMSSFASALEFDNVKDYDPITKTVTITNAFGLGATISTAQLESPLNVKVGAGVDQLVGWFNYQTIEEDVKSSFGELYLENLKNGNQIFRGGQYKVRIYEEKRVDDYECDNHDTEEFLDNNCWEVGNHLETTSEWIPMNNPNIELLPNTKYEIGIFVDVKMDDYGDWKPTFSGKEVPEWASWTEDLNTNLINYWTYEESSGDLIDQYGSNDGTNNGAAYEAEGRVDFGWDLELGESDYIETGITPEISAGDSTVSIWVKPETTATTMGIFSQREVADGNPIYEISIRSDNIVRVTLRDNGGAGIVQVDSDAEIIDNDWNNIIVTHDDGTGAVNIYINNVSEGSDTYGGGSFNNVDIQFIGAAGQTAGSFVDGIMDETGIWSRVLSEVERDFLWNNGDGIKFGDPVDNSPNITLNSPSSTNVTTIQTYELNFTAWDDINLTDVKLYVNDVLNQTNASGINNTNYLFDLKLGDGEYTIYGRATDNASQETNSSSIQINVDTINPSVAVTNPTGTLDLIVIGNNQTLNYTVTDTNLDACWLEYNGVNQSLNCSDTSDTFLYVNEVNTLTVYANDSFSNLNSASQTWAYNLTVLGQTFPTASIESATEEYIVNLSYDSAEYGVIVGVLTLDDTQYPGTRTGSGDNAVFAAEATMPVVTTPTDFTSYWTVSLTDAFATIDYNLSSNNVTVSAINLTLCDASNNVPFWNFTVLNETNLVEINSTLEVTFAVRASGSSEDNYFSFADTTGDNSQFDFCVAPGTEAYQVDAAIKLTKAGFVDKFYNYEAVALTNTTREDNLYMMTSDDSTSFIIHVVYTDAQDIGNAEVQVQRYYSGTNEWLTTEILTTNDVGTAVGHILAEDADYRFLVYLDGVSIHNSSATKITCAVTPCTVTLVIPIVTGTGYELLENVASTLIFNNNIFTYTYSDSSGSFTQARLYVIRLAPSNSTVVMPCNETKADASGIITCDITGQVNGTYQATGYITRDGPELFDKRVNGVLGTQIYDSMGEDGVLWSIFILIGIVMLGINRPSSAIIFGIIGFITLGLMNIINIGAISIVSIVAIGIVLLVRVGRE